MVNIAKSQGPCLPHCYNKSTMYVFFIILVSIIIGIIIGINLGMLIKSVSLIYYIKFLFSEILSIPYT